MRLIIISIIVMILLSLVVSAKDITIIEDNKAYTENNNGKVLQYPYITWGDKIVNLSIDTAYSKKIDVCFRLYDGINHFEIEMDKIKVKEYYDQGFCIKNVKPKHDYNLSVLYKKFGQAKYDVIILPSSYDFDINLAEINNESIILDPIVIGTPVVNFSFDYEDGTYNSTFAEELANNYDATVFGANYGLGYIGGGYDLDGDDDYLETVSYNISYSSQTVSFWINPETIATSDQIIDSWNSTNDNELNIVFAGNKISAQFLGDAGGCYLLRTTSNDISTSTWTHVIITHNGTNASIYVNGELNEGALTSNNPPCAFSDLFKTTRIGRNRLGTGYFDGKIDEILFYEGYVNSSQALQLYNVYNISTLTVSFKDETTQAAINSLNVTINIDGSISSQETQAGYLKVNGGTNINITAFSSLYPSRTRLFTQTGSAISDTMYMLSSTELQGTLQTFQTLDAQTEESLPLVQVSITSNIGGTTVTVDKGFSDSAGLFNFWGDGAKTYIATFSKSGYSTLNDVLSPSNQVRQERLTPLGAVANESLLTGQTYDYAPKLTTILNETGYNFTMNLSSTISNITACNLSLFDQTNTLLNSTLGTFNTTFCNATIDLNTYNYTQIFMILYYEKNNQLNSTYSITYRVELTYQGNSSLQNLIDDLNSFSASGFDDFGRGILAFFIVMFITTSIGATVKGFAKESEAEILLFLASLWMVSYFGWLTVTNAKIASMGIPGLDKWIVFIMYFIAGVGLVAPKFLNR